MSDGLKIRKEMLEHSTNVYLSGEVDIYTSKSFKEELNNIVDSTKLDLVIDFKDLSYIDSTGLGILVGALKKVKQNNKEVYITNIKDSIKKLFVITGLDKLFIIKE
ncbi:MAG TPA: STAS domain-containing protein [Clostridiaceae bacterium]|nr:STAS domain-containing protein [Clostridiaceae bacterium]